MLPLLPPPGRDPRLPAADEGVLYVPPTPRFTSLRAEPVTEGSASLAGVLHGNGGDAVLSPAIPVRPDAGPLPSAQRRRRPHRDLPTRVIRHVTAADEAAFATLETEVGGRQSLCTALAGADLNADEARAIGMLADPANDGVSLAKVCALAGMPLARLMKLFDQVVLVKGQLKARARIAEKLPDVAAGVMEDALPGERVCLTCNGFGQFPMPTPNDKDAVATCEACLGKGTVRHQPDTDVRKLALEIGGLLTKGSGTRTMIVNQNTAAAGAVGMGAGGASGTPESFDQLMAQLDGALYGSGRDRTRRGAGSAAQASTEGEDNTVDGEVI